MVVFVLICIMRHYKGTNMLWECTSAQKCWLESGVLKSSRWVSICLSLNWWEKCCKHFTHWIQHMPFIELVGKVLQTLHTLDPKIFFVAIWM